MDEYGYGRTLGVRRRPEGLGVEGPLPLPLVYPDDGGFKLGTEYHQIQKVCFNKKYLLVYKVYAPIQKIPSITKYMHLQTDKEKSYLPVSTRRPRPRLRSDPCNFCLERRPFYSMFISNKFYGAKQTEDLENRICRTNNGRQLLTFI